MLYALKKQKISLFLDPQVDFAFLSFTEYQELALAFLCLFVKTQLSLSVLANPVASSHVCLLKYKLIKIKDNYQFGSQLQ